jgi:hypothetical protein
MTSAVTASSSLGRLGSGSQQPTPSSRVTSALSLGGGAMSTRRRRQIAGGSVVMVLLTVSLIALLVWLLVIRPNALAADEASKQ